MDEMHELSNDLVILVARVVRDIRRNYAEIPGASTRLMSLIDELGPSTVSRLAERDQCSQPTMTGLVNGLVERDWLERAPHPDDARASLVRLTPLGEQTLAQVRRTHAERIAARLAETDHDLNDVRTTVALLRDLLPTDPAPVTEQKGRP